MIGIISGIVIGVLLIALLVFFLFKKSTKKDNGNLNLFSKQHDVKNHLFFLYRIYMVTPVVKRYFGKIKSRYRSIFPADEITLNKKTTERMTLCLSVCLGVFILVCITCRGDLLHSIAGFLICYILFTNMVNSSEESMQMKLLSQLDTFISDIHSYYHDTEMVDEAINASLDDLPYEIGLHANKIYSIVTAVDVEAEVEKYVETAPNKFLLLLAAICASVMEYGDTSTEDGRSVFLQNLTYLKSELNMERIRLRKRVIAFSGKIISVLAPLFCLRPLELYMMKNFSDTSSFYEGAGGIVSLAIILVSTFICYEAINALKDDHNDNDTDARYLRKISEFPPVKNILKSYTEKNYTKVKRMGDYLKATGDKNGTNVFMVKRVCVALLLIVVTNVIAVSAVWSEKSVIISDFSKSYESSLVPNEEYRTQMQDLSIAYSGKINNPEKDKEAYVAQITEQLGDEDMAEMVVNEIISKKEELRKHYYKWYMLLISLAAGVIGYYIPFWLLKYKKKIMGMNREDEVAQFRTLILILMHEDGMTLDTILDWMERFAHAFKSSISDCIINLEYSQQDALEKMREEESGFAPFRRLCDSLITADKVGIEGAFDDLETEREYYQEQRKLDNDVILARCTRKANRIQMVPIWEILLLYLIIPFGLYAFNMFVNFTSILHM